MFAKFIAPVILVASFTQFAFAQTEFPATLAGHAVLPAQTFIDPPADAPEDLKISGKFTDGLTRNEKMGTFEDAQQAVQQVYFYPSKGNRFKVTLASKRWQTVLTGSSQTMALAPRPTHPMRPSFCRTIALTWPLEKSSACALSFFTIPIKKYPSELFMKAPQSATSQVLTLTQRAFKSLVVNFGSVKSLVHI